MVEQTRHYGVPTTQTNERRWYTLKIVNEECINWAALKTNVETPLRCYPKPLSEED